MKILVCDFLIVKAHKTVNLNIVRAMAKIAEIDLISVNGYYDEERNELEKLGVNIKDIQTTEMSRGKILSRLYSYRLMRLQSKLLDKKYDLVVSLAFETIVFAAGRHLFKNIPLCIFHHKNTDELCSRVKRRAFDLYKNKVYNIVFEQFFSEYLINSCKTDCDHVLVIPHPIAIVEKTSDIINYDCVGISNSNSESDIDNLVDNNELLKENNIHILLRSKRREIELSNIKVIKGFLPLDEYYQYINSAKAIFVPLPSSFIYRLSASIYDAIAHRKMVITTSIKYVEEYSKRYPGICFYAENVGQFVDVLKHSRIADDIVIDRFIADHSLDMISECMRNQFMKTIAK